MQDEFGPGESRAAAADAFALDFIGRVAQARGIDKHHRDAADVRGLFNGIARGSGYR